MERPWVLTGLGALAFEELAMRGRRRDRMGAEGVAALALLLAALLAGECARRQDREPLPLDQSWVGW